MFLNVSIKIFLLLLLFQSCQNRNENFVPVYYFPTKNGTTWSFNGEINRIKITDSFEIESSNRQIVFTYFDSLNTPLWLEHYKLEKGQLYWESFEPTFKLLPKIDFDPPLPLAPMSNKIGQTTNLVSIETQTDTIKSTSEIKVNYLIEAIEDLKVPAGSFNSCIKLKMQIEYPHSTIRPFFVGEHYWWFAPLVGPVKYDLPFAQGELIEYKKGTS